jgi:short-subunit dehydrogenase
MTTTLITGATAGIGAAFARYLAGLGHDLVLVARDKDRLLESARSLADTYGVTTEILVADLSNARQLARVEKRLADPVRPIDALINNAGYGIRGTFATNSLEAEETMFEVLVHAPLRLCHVAARHMAERGGGSILNVSSVAGWWPRSTYSAAKSYMTVFSQSLNRELRGSGVRVTALCPGFTRTEFHARGDFDMSSLPRWAWLNANAVAAAGWRDLNRGKSVSVPGVVYKALRFVLRFAR